MTRLGAPLAQGCPLVGRDVRVELTEAQILAAVQIGVRRHFRAKGAGWPDRVATHSGLLGDVVGAIGEFALCLAVGVEWVDEGYTGATPDVAGAYLRTTNGDSPEILKGRHLLIRPPDPSGVYVLGLYGRRVVTFPGWIMSDAAILGGTQSPWWRGDAWWIPQTALGAFPWPTV